MRLAPRLVLAFVSVAALSVAGVGYVVREDRREQETARVEDEVRSACERVTGDLRRQAESDRNVVGGACQAGELVDRTLVAVDADQLDMRRLALAALVPKEREAFGLDELVLATSDGDILGADPKALLGASRADVQASMRAPVDGISLRTGDRPALVSRCRRQAASGRAVGLVGAREIRPMLDHLGETLKLGVSTGMPATSVADIAQATCPLTDTMGVSIPIVVTKSKGELYGALAHIDQTVLVAGMAATGLALLLAVLLARSIGRPLSELAKEARKVAAGEARPIAVRGSGEVAELTRAFDRMLEDLDVTRRRLAATTRVAAWREVARRVAHEVKNPLAPIRAAVETLRRLRARQDPAFDGYFDEATSTVLSEVHRISNIVTEFTRFARLAAPRPEEIDLVTVTRDVVQIQKADAGGARIDVIVPRVPPLVRADRDQILQVLTNILQNALDAVGRKPGGEVRVTIDSDDPSRASVTVGDNGPGIAPEIASRLFEPYATTKAQGTGLGRALAQRIAIEHNGELAFIAPKRAGDGATFRLMLPVEGPPPSSSETPVSG
jgi:signal transduction histidine kinase